MFRYYTAIVHKDEDSAWGAYFPDIEGVFSAADEEKDIRKNLIEALELAFEGRSDLPKQRGIDDLQRDAEIRKDILDGAFFYNVPIVARTGRTVRANITMDAGELAAIDTEAKRRGLTRSAFLSEGAKALLG